MRCALGSWLARGSVSYVLPTMEWIVEPKIARRSSHIRLAAFPILLFRDARQIALQLPPQYSWTTSAALHSIEAEELWQYHVTLSWTWWFIYRPNTFSKTTTNSTLLKMKISLSGTDWRVSFAWLFQESKFKKRILSFSGVWKIQVETMLSRPCS